MNINPSHEEVLKYIDSLNNLVEVEDNGRGYAVEYYMVPLSVFDLGLGDNMIYELNKKTMI